MQSDRRLIFHPCENGRFITNIQEECFRWTGEYIGDVTSSLNQLPAMKSAKLYIISPANQYVVLEKYDVKTHIINLIKRIYGMFTIPYNLCLYKKKQYIMYQYIPFVEIEYTAFRKKQEDINDDERRIIFLHWILGVKGKMLRIVGGYNISLSHSKYSEIDYIKSNISSHTMDKFFGDYHSWYNTSLFFKDTDKINAIRNLMNESNYWWFQEIEKRINQLVNIKK